MLYCISKARDVSFKTRSILGFDKKTRDIIDHTCLYTEGGNEKEKKKRGKPLFPQDIKEYVDSDGRQVSGTKILTS